MAVTAKGTKLSRAEAETLRAFHKSWPLRLVPDRLKPYAELIRIHRPAGIMMFYFPCLYGTFLVGAMGHHIPLEDMFWTNAKLLLLSFILRGVLCTWNDLIDQDVDRQVARTRVRPLARRAISTTDGLVWTLIQLGFVGGAFAILPTLCSIYAIPFLVLHSVYPFTKQWTHHPQLVLGFAHSLGVFLAFPALGRPLPTDILWSGSTVAAIYLSATIIFWTLLNDTIYAAQDAEDDAKAGIGSTVLFWGESTRTFLRALGLAQLGALIGLGYAIRDSVPEGGRIYIALTCGGTALSLLLMIEGVDLKNSASCGWWFNRGNVLVGWALASGLVGEYLLGLSR